MDDLDVLLADLQNTPRTSRRKISAASLDEHPLPPTPVNVRAVEELLDELDVTVSHSKTTFQTKPITGRATVMDVLDEVTTPSTASSTTRELDDLIASLSDFKKNYAKEIESNNRSDENTSRPPSSLKSTSSSTILSSHDYANIDPHPTYSIPQTPEKNLDSMLGSLQTDMFKQGVATVPKGPCAACRKPIVGTVCTALGKTWHPEHFICCVCDVQLGNQTFFEKDGKPYCERDYQEKFAPKCHACHGAITETCVTTMDHTWHPQCFVCATCRKPFGESAFHEKDGKAYCREDFMLMFAPKCCGCNQAMVDDYITALDGHWHSRCFVCTECRQPFKNGSFFVHNGKPYCESHYHSKRGTLCYKCKKPITGRCITAMQRKFHKEHFCCSYCLKSLDKGTFKEQNDKPYCHGCFIKLFA